MKKILLLMIGISVLVSAKYVRNGDIVTDTDTGLQWQDNLDVVQRTVSWYDAKKYCERLSLGGYDDWRLPTLRELEDLLDFNVSSRNLDLVTNIAAHLRNGILGVDRFIDSGYAFNWKALLPEAFYYTNKYNFWSSTGKMTHLSDNKEEYGVFQESLYLFSVVHFTRELQAPGAVRCVRSSNSKSGK